MERKNVNRGYRKLTVWEDAIAYYTATCEALAGFSFVLQRVASQQIASVDSIRGGEVATKPDQAQTPQHFQLAVN